MNGSTMPFGVQPPRFSQHGWWYGTQSELPELPGHGRIGFYPTSQLLLALLCSMTSSEAAWECRAHSGELISVLSGKDEAIVCVYGRLKSREWHILGGTELGSPCAGWLLLSRVCTKGMQQF